MPVDSCDIGLVSEPGDGIDRRQHLGDDLGWKRNVHGHSEHAQAERETERDRQDRASADLPFELGQSEQMRKPLSSREI